MAIFHQNIALIYEIFTYHFKESHFSINTHLMYLVPQLTKLSQSPSPLPQPTSLIPCTPPSPSTTLILCIPILSIDRANILNEDIQGQKSQKLAPVSGDLLVYLQLLSSSVYYVATVLVYFAKGLQGNEAPTKIFSSQRQG